MASRADYNVNLLSDASAGNGDAKKWPGGLMFLQVHATDYNSGSVTLQSEMKQGDWVTVANSGQSADGAISVYVGAGKVRAVMPAGSSGGYAEATLIPVA